MKDFNSSTWSDVEGFRTRMSQRTPRSVEEAAQEFAIDFAKTCEPVILARVFLALPFARLPEDERSFARNLVKNDSRLGDSTPVLSLLGTAGIHSDWMQRKKSRGHLAIPLLASNFVQGIPMIAKLLADLEVNLSGLDDGKPIATRPMLGGRNRAFFVPDAETSRDDDGRHIIPSRDFVQTHHVRTVLGMGGAYADGTLAVVILFTNECIERMIVDRFPSLISNFKIATSRLLADRRIYQS